MDTKAEKSMIKSNYVYCAVYVVQQRIHSEQAHKILFCLEKYFCN